MTPQKTPQPPRQRTVAACAECGETRIVAALRRCQGCYYALWRARPSEDRANQRWTPEEDATLRQLAPSHTTHDIAYLMRRSFWGVRERMHTLRITALHARNGVAREMSYADVAAALGCGRAVELWVRRGRIRATHTEQGVYSVSFGDLVDFLERGGAYLSAVRPTDPMWRSLVADARAVADGWLLRETRICAMLCVARASLYYWRMRCRPGAQVFPAPAWGGKGSRGVYYDRAAVAAWLRAHPDKITTAARKELGL